ncbi:MAG: 4-carboxy-4-hydroxy-2-oxoadipate aldolase/oxaloacetate decarboxylase [Micromonosporaceae bacterium]
MTHLIVRNTQRPDPTVIAELGELGVSTVHEAMGRRGLVQPVLNGIYRGARMAGAAVTVLSKAGDNLMIHAAVEQCQQGDVLVVATMSPSTDGMFGELLATSLRSRGVAGLVIDGGVRDVTALTQMRFPVWSRAISAQGTVKTAPGSVNVPIVIAGAYVRPGDVIVADDDGVVVVPSHEAATVAKAGRAREEAEEAKRAQFTAGVLGLDMYGLREQLAALGVRYVDEDDQPAPGATSSNTSAPGAAAEQRDARDG